MKCSRCGETIPAQSQFCLRCGTPVSASAPTTLPHQSPARPDATVADASNRSGGFQSTQLVGGQNAGFTPPGAPPGTPGATNGRPMPGQPARAVRRAGLPRGIVIALLILGVALLGGGAAVLHGRSAVANANAYAANSGAVANQNATPLNGGAVANQNATPLNGGALANATANPGNPGAIANGEANAPPQGPLANQPGPPTAQTADDSDDVDKYLRALARIEAERQQVNAQIDAAYSGAAGSAAGGQHVTDPQAVMSRLLAQEISSVGDDNGPDPLTKAMEQMMPALNQTALAHVQLVQEIDGLESVPGVPPSCKDLQGFYRAAVTPFVSLANADRSNPVAFLQKAMQAQNDEKNRLVEAEQALEQVFRTHPKVTFRFSIKNTEDTGDAGGVMSAPYVPGH